MRVKICGVTTVADARMSAAAGADAIGLNFYSKSSRFISVARARKIVAALPPFVWAVGVFVNEREATVTRIAREVGLHAIQLHGDEPASMVARFRLPVFKALHVGARALSTTSFRAARVLVVDAAQPGYGGGGKRFEWSRAKAIAAARPVLLAGGLTPENVASAIGEVHPLGVDVASGVEKRPGHKDPHAVAEFIRAARSAA
jgi:phosphoribosylanthranilate isomerase